MSPFQTMDDGTRKWIFRTARKNLWRVATWYDLEDLVQDGVACYYRVVSKYPKVKDRPHIMRLFQIAFINDIHNLAKRRTRDIVVVETQSFARSDCFEQELGNLAVQIAQAPAHIKAVLQLLSTEDGVKRMRCQYRIRRDFTRETFNERLARLTGFPPEVDMVGSFERYFSVR